MTYAIIDTAEPLTHKYRRLPGLKTAIRYISSAGSQAKVITPTEARTLAKAGIRVALVHEWWGDFAHGGINARAGKRDGAYARVYAAKVGAPPGAAIYFAVDTDTPPARIRDSVIPYFREVRKALGTKYKVGLYGPGAACAATIAAGFVDYGWLANAKGWAGYKAFKPHAHLVQLLPKKVSGVDFDPDIAQKAEWGDFLPFAPVHESEKPSEKPVDDSEELASATAPVPAEHTEHTEDEAPDILTSIEEKRSLWERIKDLIPTPIQSKVAWLITAMGGTGVASVDRSDPGFMNAVLQSMHTPTFWLMTVIVVCTAGGLYYYWKNPSGSKSWL